MKLALFLLLIAFAPTLRAEEKDPLLRKPWLFVGLDAGYAHLGTDVPGEESKSGLGVSAKGLLSYYWDKVVGDAGLGIQYKSISGTRPTGTNYTLEVRSAFVEVGARYRFTPKFSAGPFLQPNFGADLSHRPTEAPLITEPEKNFLFELGLQGLYEMTAGNLPLRMGLRATTAVGVPNGRSIFDLQAVAQIGFDLQGAPPPPPAPAPEPQRDAKFIDLPLLKVFFAVDSAKLDAKARRSLRKVGEFLMNNRSRYFAVGIMGHTDQTGPAEYNQELSEKRAAVVVEQLEKAGLASEKIRAKGYGFRYPASTSDAKNRRAVIRLFSPPKDGDPFLADLIKLTTQD